LTRVRVARILLIVLGVWAAVGGLAVLTIFLLAKPDSDNPAKFSDERAVVFMGVTLMAVWCLIGGILQRVLRDPFKRLIRRIPIGWRTKFVLLCILFALLEEAVTTGLMVYLPACTVPEDRKVRRVRWWYWPITVVVLLFAGVPFVPVVFLIRWLIGYTGP